MRIAITGSSGLMGTALRKRLAADGHEIRRIVRHRPQGPEQIGWDPGAHKFDPTALDGIDAVIHLAGVGIGDHRWTAERKKLIRDSRVDGTTTISTAFTAIADPPKVLISASAVGWYGDTGDRQVDETAPPGRGFLAELCESWEAATEPARAAGARVAAIRSGLVLAPNGGIMSRLKPLFTFGLGGKIGSGKQYWPWISLADQIDAICFLLEHDVAGPVNLTGPVPVTNAEFTRVLGSIVHRPALLPIPPFALRAVIGEFADEGVLIGQRAVPAKLSKAGFIHTHSTLEQALRWATSG
jgi:hypothetical protein